MGSEQTHQGESLPVACLLTFAAGLLDIYSYMLRGHVFAIDGDNEGCWYPYNNDKGHTATLSDIRSYAAFMLNNPRAMQVAKDFLDGKFTDVPPLSGRKSDLFSEGFCNDRGVVWHSSDSRAAAIRFNATWEEISYYWCPA